MKKLMIAAAVVCAAVVSQAAAINWSVEDSYNPWNEGEEIEDEGFTAYFFMQNATIAGGESTAFSKAQALAAIESGSLTFLDNALTDKFGDAAAPVEYGGAGAEGVGNFADGGTDPNTVTGYLVILNPDQTYAFVTDFASTDIDSLGSSNGIEFGDLTDTASIEGWTKVGAVPEPTSGLLLLIGVAGLALRRRRA